MPIQLGRTPDLLTLTLVAGDPFACELLLDGGGNWPAGTVCALQVGSQTWAAAVVGNALRFQVSAAQVATALADQDRSTGLHLDGVTVAKGQVAVY